MLDLILEMNERSVYVRDDEARVRVYCWRVGGCVSLAPGEKCPECGSTNHARARDNKCDNFVGCRNHGHPCDLVPGHEGKCALLEKPNDADENCGPFSVWDPLDVHYAKRGYV